MGFEGLRKVPAVIDRLGCVTTLTERVSQTPGLYPLRVPEAGHRAPGASGVAPP